VSKTTVFSSSLYLCFSFHVCLLVLLDLHLIKYMVALKKIYKKVEERNLTLIEPNDQ
jgi:hypothetical protein